jgi:HTH-type transcriptional regulator / antitoxin HipB
LALDYVVHFVDQLKPHLRALRNARGLTQTQLSKKLNVVQSRIATIENKPEVMSAEQLFRLLVALDAFD